MDNPQQNNILIDDIFKAPEVKVKVNNVVEDRNIS